jgi:heptosyltransferase II
LRFLAKKAVKSFYLNSRKAVLGGAGRALRLGRLRPLPDSDRISKILFIRTDRIGDMVVSTPALRAIKKGLPHARLTVLASRSNAPLLQHDPYVDEVIVWNQGQKAAAPIGFLRQAGRLAKAGYDAVIDPMPGSDLYTALIAYLSGAVLRIGFPGFGRDVFFNHLAGDADGRHMVDLILETTLLLGAAPEGRLPHICLLPIEGERAGLWLRARNLGTRPIVGIHPGGYYPTQRWPAEYYAQLALALRHDNAMDIVLIGGGGDRDLINSIFEYAGERFAVFESTDLRESVALVSRLNLLVCNNSGPLHIAAALEVSTVSFMGPTEKNRWMPLGLNHKVLRRDYLECIGCNSGTCIRGDLACMRRIKPEEAVNGAMHLLKKSA